MRVEYIGECSYALTEIDSLTSRKQFKLNVFLSTNEMVSVLHEGNSIIITILNNEEKTIYFLDQYLKNLGVVYNTDEHYRGQIKKYQDEQHEQENIVHALTETKASCLNSLEFQEFQAYCNSHMMITLKEYQYLSAYRLYLGNGGFDFSVPGAGKTIISYAAYSYMKFKNKVQQLFIIGPISAYNAWMDEYKTCFGYEADYISLTNMSKPECKLYLNSSANNHHEICFINYEKCRLFSKEISAYLSAASTLLVIDEAHKIKSPNAKTTISISKFSPQALARVMLTGTPIPNGYEDLFSLMNIYSPQRKILPYNYSQLKAFTKNGTKPIEEKRIKDSISPFYSRVSKKYLYSKGELQEPLIQYVQIDFDDDQDELYTRLDQFCHKLHDAIDEDLLMALKKAVLIRKMQISANPALLKRTIAETMDEFYEEALTTAENAEQMAIADRQIQELFSGSQITKVVNRYANGVKQTPKNIEAIRLAQNIVDSGRKVLLWDVFVQNMETVHRALSQIYPGRVEIINGLVSQSDRQLALSRFREGNSSILIANPATLAESISLHKTCQDAIYINRNFNCAQYIQSKDRIHRINMPFGVKARYYFILNRNCIDESIDERLKTKEERMLKILDSDDILVGGDELEENDVMTEQDINSCFDRR